MATARINSDLFETLSSIMTAADPVDTLLGVQLDFGTQLDALQTQLVGEWTVVSATPSRVVLEQGTVRIVVNGSGMGPLTSLNDFMTAVLSGTATGTLSSLIISDGGTTILGLTLTGAELRVVSGDQSVIVEGTLPTSFAELPNLLAVLSLTDPAAVAAMTSDERSNIVTALTPYTLTDLTVMDGTDVIVSVELQSDSLRVVTPALIVEIGATIPGNLGALAQAVFGTNPTLGTSTLEMITQALAIESLLITSGTGTELVNITGISNISDPLVIILDGITLPAGTPILYDLAALGTALTASDIGSLIIGTVGLDTLTGGAGDDWILGLAGDDQIAGQDGNDRIMGDDGNDTISGGAGNDFIGGGAGNDLIYTGDGSNTFFGGYGYDTIHGGADDDVIHGSAGRNVMLGNDGTDLIQAGNAGDFMGGGAGNDTLRGGDGADTIYAGMGNDFVGAGAGNDVIYGSAGSNIIYAGLGNDTVQGGTGSDTIIGGGGRNRLLGNDGNDLIYTASSGDFAAGGNGNDTVYGSSGNDTIYAGAGNDLIGGGGGSDVIYAGAGSNRIWGGSGNDRIIAGLGRDVMIGGSGADVIVFVSSASIGIGASRDVITDFNAGVDDIDLTGLGQTFNGSAGLIGGGTASFFYHAASGLVIGDQNGDGIADWVIELTGAPAVTNEDFLL